MRLLLDTHAFLWAVSDPKQLRKRARDAIQNPANDIFISAATAWEIALKVSLNKLTIAAAPAVWFPARVQSLGFQNLAIAAAHALALSALPAIHDDPFDRILIAQAQVEGLTFVTRDSKNLKYPIHLLEC